jgi:hypothetical protein
MDREDLELFDRSLRHAVQRHTGADLDAALVELGWREALAEDDQAAVSLLFGHLGSANVACAALDRVVAGALGLHATSAAVVLPALGRCDPPGHLHDDRLRVEGLALAGITDQASALVVAAATDGPVALVVPTASLGLRPVAGLDPALRLVAVSGEVADGSAVPHAHAQADALTHPGPDPDAHASGVAHAEADGSVPSPTPWGAAAAVAQLAIGHELVGASRRMLELAREHAVERVQFGRPISGFQAVRHRLAETLVAVEAAEAVLATGWEDRSPVTAAMAKALAGRGARTAARHCQQVLAGIGFTTEHPLHLYVRRVLVLDELFGSARSLTADLGRDLLETRRLPALLPL